MIMNLQAAKTLLTKAPVWGEVAIECTSKEANKEHWKWCKPARLQ
jgi:hypothetical protein